MIGTVILETRALTKEFEGFVAVSKVDLGIRAGSIHALIGPNGAGKTTVFNLITRVFPATSGTIHFKGRDITTMRAAETARQGLVRSFQISSVFPHLTVAENVRLAVQRKLGTSFQFWRSDDSLAILDMQVLAILESFDLAGHARVNAGELPYGRKRALELAATLAAEPDLLLLDEPTQGMGSEDISRVVELIRKAAAGRSVLLVEHNLGVVADLCDRITVLARGAVLAEGSYDEVAQDRAVKEAYLGADA
jgi:branched-chain amino acid transport system ATP-binding protein